MMKELQILVGNKIFLLYDWDIIAAVPLQLIHTGNY